MSFLFQLSKREEELLFLLQKAIADIRQTACENNISGHLQFQIERAGDIVDLIIAQKARDTEKKEI